jgi:hypothetical protein
MKLKELIPFLGENQKEIKIHCARGSQDEFAPKKAFLNGDFKEWQEEQNQENFNRQYILSLIYWGKEEWLFAGIYEVKSVRKNVDIVKYKYDTKLLDIAEGFIGRLFLSFPKKFRMSYLCLENHLDNIELLEIRRKIVKIDFPGYENVNVSWKELSNYIKTDSWKTALKNQKGVYLITDSSNGKMYVGSAYGKNMILGRWENYISNGHGGNVDLQNISFNDIKQHFRYSILEIFKSTTDDGIIIERESWWKDVLQTRKFGYNKN